MFTISALYQIIHFMYAYIQINTLSDFAFI